MKWTVERSCQELLTAKPQWLDAVRVQYIATCMFKLSNNRRGFDAGKVATVAMVKPTVATLPLVTILLWLTYNNYIYIRKVSCVSLLWITIILKKVYTLRADKMRNTEGMKAGQICKYAHHSIFFFSLSFQCSIQCQQSNPPAFMPKNAREFHYSNQNGNKIRTLTQGLLICDSVSTQQKDQNTIQLYHFLAAEPRICSWNSLDEIQFHKKRVKNFAVLYL